MSFKLELPTQCSSSESSSDISDINEPIEHQPEQYEFDLSLLHSPILSKQTSSRTTGTQKKEIEIISM